MAEANGDQPGDTALLFRMGLHLGDLIVDGDECTEMAWMLPRGWKGKLQNAAGVTGTRAVVRATLEESCRLRLCRRVPVEFLQSR